MSPIALALGPEEADLHRAQALSPGDATLWFWSGILNLNSGRVDEACRDWNRSLTLWQGHLDEIMLASRGRLTVRQLLEQTLPAEPDLLFHVASRHFGEETLAKYREIFLARAADALDDSTLPPAELAYTHGAILRLQGKTSEAVPYYTEAVTLQSKNLAWRFELARLLMDLEEYDLVQEHVVYLVHARPKFNAYQRLKDEFESKRWRVGSPVD